MLKRWRKHVNGKHLLCFGSRVVRGYYSTRPARTARLILSPRSWRHGRIRTYYTEWAATSRTSLENKLRRLGRRLCLPLHPSWCVPLSEVYYNGALFALHEALHVRRTFPNVKDRTVIISSVFFLKRGTNVVLEYWKQSHVLKGFWDQWKSSVVFCECTLL